MNIQKKELLDEICNLKNQISERAEAREALEIAEFDVQNAQTFSSKNLKAFDEKEKEKFIKSIIGEKPEKPSKWAIGKKKKYEKDLQTYIKKRVKAESEFEESFAEIRKSLKEKDRAEYEDNINKAKKSETKAKDRFAAAEKAVDENDFLGPDLKNNEAIDLLYSYIINNRADTIKEAVELYFEEKHIEEQKKREDEFRKQILNVIDEEFNSMKNQIVNLIDEMTDNVVFKLENSVNVLNSNISETIESEMGNFSYFISDTENKIDNFLNETSVKIKDTSQN